MLPKADNLLSNLDWIFALWLLLVILWNYGYPEAAPLLDVLAAVILLFTSKLLRN